MKPAKCYLFTFIMLCFCTVCLAVPAKRGDLRLVQPDGKTIIVTISGDEFGHILRLKDGCAVVLGKDGFYHYAVNDAAGKLVATDYIAGRTAPAELRSRSRMASLQVKKHLLPEMAPQKTSRVPEDEATGRVIVIPAEFKDLELKNGVGAFETLMAKAKSYFDDQFDGKRVFNFDVSPIATLSRGYAYYGENDSDGLDKRALAAVQEAVNLVDDDVDFSLYDFVYVFYAGGSPADGSADDDHIWPHSASNIRLITNEKTFRNYAMSSELMKSDNSGRIILAGIGTFCHEYGHQLGLRDMYDSDYEKSGGRADGLWWTTSLMDGGCYNDDTNTPPCLNAIELEQLGIVEPEKLAIGDYDLKPLSTNKRILRMDTDNPGEYYLFECRTKSGWDQFIGAPGGLLIYHVDRSQNETGYSEYYERNLTAAERWEYNEVNARRDHSCAQLIAADPTIQAYYYDSEKEQYYFDLSTIPNIFFPSVSGFNEYSAKSPKPFRFWSGQLSPLSILNIKRVEGSSNFVVAGPITLDDKYVYQDAIILNWHTDYSAFENIPANITFEGPDETKQFSVRPYEKGKFSVTIDGLKPKTNYSYTITFGDGSEEDSTMIGTFTTKAINGLPFIYLQDTKRTITGYFTAESMLPLRVYNAVDAVAVRWYLDGRSISTGADGFYHLRSGGLLKAVVFYPDGSKDIITKKIEFK